MLRLWSQGSKDMLSAIGGIVSLKVRDQYFRIVI